MEYLDGYGIADARREKLFKGVVVTLLVSVVVGSLLYVWFKNYPQERRVKQFLAAVEAGGEQAQGALRRSQAYPNPGITLAAGRGRPRDGGASRSESSV